MRMLLRIFLLAICMTLTPLFVLLLTPKIFHFSSQTIKNELIEAKVYDSIVKNVDNRVNAAIVVNNANDKALIALANSLKKEFTVSYVQDKSENLIDESFLYIQGKSADPPVLSFKDIKDNVLKTNPKYAKQFEEIEKMMLHNAPQPDDEVAEVMMDQIPFPEGKVNDLGWLAQQNYSIPIGKTLAPVRQYYQYYTMALPITGVIIALSLVLIILLSKGVTEKLIWLSITMLLSSLSGLFMMVMLATSSQILLQGLLEQNNPTITALVPALKRILKILFADYYKLQTIVSGIVFGASILGLISVLIVNALRKNKPTPSAV